MTMGQDASWRSAWPRLGRFALAGSGHGLPGARCCQGR